MIDVLSIRNLSVELQGKTILSEIALNLAAGDILGLVGPSGCGKTTLLNTVAGFVEVNKGELIINNSTVITPENTLPPEQRNVGMIFQDYALFPHLTAEQNILFGIEHLPKIERVERLEELLELLALKGLEKRFPHQISGGQQQRVAIARALAPQPQLLLLDEPFSNIDARLRNELMVELRTLLKKLKISAVFVTHNKDEVFSFADKIAVMHEGEILQVGTPVEVCKQPKSWQVADFLQLGSWLAIKRLDFDAIETALGKIAVSNDLQKKLNDQAQHTFLLLKPQNIKVVDTLEPNVKIDHISINEQGYYYVCSSLAQTDDSLSFTQLRFYSDQLFLLNQKVALQIKPHEPVIF